MSPNPLMQREPIASRIRDRWTSDQKGRAFMDTLRDFEFTSVSGRVPAPPIPNPYGALALLVGTWKGHGFNQIWRPNTGGADHFLELNETIEPLEFADIPGD